MGRAAGNRDEWWGAEKGAGRRPGKESETFSGNGPETFSGQSSAQRGATGAPAPMSPGGADGVGDSASVPACTSASVPAPTHAHPEPDIPFDPVVVAEEAGIVVVDKPPFLASTPNGRLVRATVLQRLRDRFGEPDLTCVHRLDRLTSGLLLVSRDPATRGAYQRLFQDGRVRKTYEALTVVPDDWAPGESRDVVVELANVDGERGVRVRDPLLADASSDGVPDTADATEPTTADSIPDNLWRTAATRVTYVGTVASDVGDVLPGMFGGAAGAGHSASCSCGACGTRMTVGKWRLEPSTGRTHQLRATMAHLGYPILGDDTYPDDLGLDLGNVTRVLRLVATELLYDDPLDGSPRHFRSNRDVADPLADPSY
ncbi:tRNA pseudouridine synthase C [Corynebacterium hansenii]|nr:tRNA pseudouridine synthase C [Corynebacterium hansenii]